LVLNLVANVLPTHNERFDIVHEGGRLHDIFHEMGWTAPSAIAFQDKCNLRPYHSLKRRVVLVDVGRSHDKRLSEVCGKAL